MKKDNTFISLLICFFITRTVQYMFEMWFQANDIFVLLSIFVCLACFIYTLVVYFKNVKLLLKYPVFLPLPIFSLFDIIFDSRYKYRDAFGLFCVLLAVITLINVIVEKKTLTQSNTGDGSG